MSNKPRIIFFAPRLYPCKTGGMEIYNYHLLINIKKKYPKLEIIVFTTCNLLIDKYDYFYPIKDRLFITRRWGLGTLSNFIYYTFSRKINWRKIRKIFIPYTSNSNNNVIVFLLFKKIYKIKYCIHIHGGGVKSWKPFLLQKIFFKAADNIAGVSYPIIKEYTRRSGREIEFLPPIIAFKKTNVVKEIIKKNKGLNQYKKIVLFVGILKPLKSPVTLLDAFLTIEKDFIISHGLGLVFVGDGPLMDELIVRSQSSGCKDFIHFAGRIPNENISDYYAIANIFVIPSWYEGTPIALLEAMFNGLVCIGSNVEGINSIIKDKTNGLLFEKNNFTSLSNLIKHYIENENLGSDLKNNALHTYNTNYNYNNHLQAIKKFIV